MIISASTAARKFPAFHCCVAQCRQALVLDIFGSTFGASLFGIAFASHQIGSFFGSWLGGKIYDTTGSCAFLAAITHDHTDTQSLENHKLPLLCICFAAHGYISQPVRAIADAIMWWVNIGFGIFAALVHAPISNEPYAKLLEESKTKRADAESQADRDTTKAQVESKTADNMP